MKRKSQAACQHTAWKRGAFSRPRWAVPGAAKPDAKADTTDATRANVGATGANGRVNP